MNGEDQPWGVGRVRLVVPEHELVRCIGEGSYGQVWLARSSLGEWRAVKLVPVVSNQNCRSYEREFTGVRRFEPLSREDEGFVDILQTGQDATGEWFYYVMELADDAETDAPWRGGSDPGRYVPKTLSRVLRTERRMPVRECLVMGLRLVRALGRLHSAGLLHRDVKPSNVVFIQGQAKLADIGLVVDQSEARSYVGTDGYIPPEGPNTPQADIYGLGMVLYEAGMGMGQESFPVANPEIRTDPDAPLLRELNAVVLRACAGNPAQRYASAQALEEDLALLKDGGSVRQRRRWIRGRRRTLRFGAAAMAAVFVWVLFSWILRPWMSRSGRSDPGALAQVRQAAELQVERGNRLAIDQDPVGALLWYAEALPLMASFPELQQAHRVRIGQMLNRVPRSYGVLDCGSGLHSVALSADAERVATSNRNGDVTVWSVRTGERLHGPHSSGGNPVKVRFSRDGMRLLLAPSVDTPAIHGARKAVGSAIVIDAASGQPVVPVIHPIAWGVFSPDGRWMAAVKPGNEVWFHSVDGSVAPRLLAVHAGPVGWIEFSPDGSLVGACADDRTAQVWRVADGRPACPSLSLAGQGLGIAFHPDCRTLTTVSLVRDFSTALQQWDIPSGRAGSCLVVPSNLVTFVKYDEPLGNRLLLGAMAGRMCVRDAHDVGKVIADIGFEQAPMQCWALSPDGQRAAAGGADGSVRVWHVPSGQPVTPILHLARSTQWIQFSGDGSRLLAAAADGLVRIWDVPGDGEKADGVRLSGDPLPVDPSEAPYPASMDSTGKHLMITVARNGRRVAAAVDLERGEEQQLPAEADDLPCEAWVAAHGTRAWAAFDPQTSMKRVPRDIALWRRDGRGWSRRRIPQPVRTVMVRFSSDDRQLITLGFDRRIRWWDVETGELIASILVEMPAGPSFGFSDDGRKSAWVIPGAQTLHIQDLLPSGIMDRAVHLSEPWRSAHWLPGSDLIMGITLQQRTHFWDLTQRTLVAVSEGPSLGSSSVGHAQSRRIVAVDGFGVASVIDLSRRQSQPLLDDSGNLRARRLSFSPDGRFVVVLGMDGRIHVQEAASGLAVLPGADPLLRGRWAAITPDDELIVLADSPIIRRWQLAPVTVPDSDLPDLARVLSGRQIDEAGHVNWIQPSLLARTARKHRDPRLQTGLNSEGNFPVKKRHPSAR